MSSLHSGFHIDLLIVLLLIASTVAITVKWIKLPYSIALVIVGLAIGVFHLLPPIEMTPELILVVFLPALLFEASWNLELTSLKGNWAPVGILATIGVLISMVIVATFMQAFGAMGPGAALLFGAMISATDPISVIALFRKLGISKRLTMVLEGESLFNDGTAVVLFELVLAIVVAQASIVPLSVAGNFIVVVAGGTLVGLVLGYAASRITSYFDDHLLEITLTTILAYGSFLIADQLGVSPVIAVVTAGIFVGNYGSRTGMSATTRLAVNSFWEYAAFVVNSLVFLLIGLQVKFDLLVKYAPVIGIGILAILIGRIAVIYGLCPLIATKLSPIPWQWRHLLVWGALRGSLCMALALSLPLNFPQRECIIITTFGVVLFTLLVQGLSIEPLVRFLKMAKFDPRLAEYRSLKTQLVIQGKARDCLNSLLESEHVSQKAFEQLEKEVVTTQEGLRRKIDDLHLANGSIQEIELNETRQRLLEVRKDCLIELARKGVITHDVLNDLKAEIDSEMQELIMSSQPWSDEPAKLIPPAAPPRIDDWNQMKSSRNDID